MPDVEGGYLKVKKRLWKGVLRNKDDESIFWRCSHNHSRPEFNARYRKVDEQTDRVPVWGVTQSDATISELVWDVWEFSALNCGRAAYRQYVAGETPQGAIGAIGSDDVPEELRPNTRFARIDGTDFTGRLHLNDNGHRIIELMLGDSSDTLAALNLDVARKKGVTLKPELDTDMLSKAVTALWYLKGTVFGVTFQDCAFRLVVTSVDQRAIEELLVDKRSKRPSHGLQLPVQQLERKTAGRTYAPGEKPRLEVSDRQGSRLYEVVDASGVVVESFRRRGDAAARLKELR